MFFELIQIEVKCSKTYFKIFLSQETGAFENNMKKKLQKPRPNLKKMYIMHLHKIFALRAIQFKR